MTTSARTTGEQVKEIINTSLTATQVEPFINVAHLIVEEQLSGVTSLSDDLLSEIERWLTAHLVSIRTPTIKSKSVDGASISYDVGNLGEGLKSTRYGQMVLTMDSTGSFASAGKRKALVESISLGL